MFKKHPTGQMIHKSGFDAETDLSLARAVATNPEYIKKTMAQPKCDRCGWVFSLWSINKARSSGRIKCPQCGARHNLRELVKDGTSETGY